MNTRRRDKQGRFIKEARPPMTVMRVAPQEKEIIEVIRENTDNLGKEYMIDELTKKNAIVISRHKATKEYFNDLPQLERLESMKQIKKLQEQYGRIDTIIGNLPLGMILDLPYPIYTVFLLTFPSAEKGKEYTREEFEKECKMIKFTRPHPYGENADCRWLLP